jgi:hypothetical protein
LTRPLLSDARLKKNQPFAVDVFSKLSTAWI